MMSATILRPVVRSGLGVRAVESIRKLPLWALWLLFVAILFLRHPQAILHADFWGEDGSFWYNRRL